jgi:hypothetical protein
VRIMRSAISPRFAIRTFPNIGDSAIGGKLAAPATIAKGSAGSFVAALAFELTLN